MAGIHHLPVLDDDHRLVGVITHGGLEAAMRNKSLAREPIEPIEPSSRSWNARS